LHLEQRRFPSFIAVPVELMTRRVECFSKGGLAPAPGRFADRQEGRSREATRALWENITPAGLPNQESAGATSEASRGGLCSRLVSLSSTVRAPGSCRRRRRTAGAARRKTDA
jgi:hypothetical protein